MVEATLLERRMKEACLAQTYGNPQSWRELASTTRLKLIIVEGAPWAGALVDDGDGTSALPSVISFQFIVFPSVVVMLSTYSPLVSFELDKKPLI